MRAALLVLASMALAAQAAANPFTPQLDAQRRAAQNLAPSPLMLPIPAHPRRAVLTVHIRYYADEDYRSGLFRWADRVKAQMGFLNRIVEPAFGIRFEGESFRRWRRSSGNIDIFKMLAELEALDPGQGVDWVVGLVSPLALVSTSMHEIGAARILGRHLVMRGMGSAEEARSFDKSFDQMDAAEREQLYSNRKWHKECAVFLHEWLHTLGAIHSSNPERINNPGYSHRMSNLAPVDAELAAIALEARLGDRQSANVDWAALRARIEATTSPEWFTNERSELLALLRSAPARSGTHASGRSDERRPLFSTKEEVDAFNRALDLMKAGKAEEAWAAVRPLAPAAESNLEVARLMCRLSYLPAAGDEGLAACARSRNMSGNDPGPLVDAAQARLLRKERAEALAATEEAAARARMKLGGRDAAKAGDRNDIWVWIAQLYGQLGAISAAEDALANAGEKAQGYENAQAAVIHERRYLGLPRAPGGKPLGLEREIAYAERQRRAAALIDERKFAEARKAVAAARKEFPEVPGLEVLSCELEARQGHLKPAEKACTHALSVMPELPRAHYLVGHIRLQGGARGPAVESFRRAIELDPKESSAYESLADVYRMSGDKSALASLKVEYEKKFSRPLR